LLLGLSLNEMALQSEVIADIGMDCGAFLQRLHRPKPQHRLYPPSKTTDDCSPPVFRPSSDFLFLAIARHMQRSTTEATARHRAAISAQT